MWKADEAFDECRAITLEIAERGSAWEKEKNASFYSGLVVALQGVQSIYERRKNEAGVLDYVDLLVKAAEALRKNASLRSYFRRKFRAIIVDEYQDTDPLQVEIIETLAGFPGGAVEDPKLGAASYVVVGDPKQSIYRFRRADASIFAAACEAAKTRAGVELVSLTQNFRSTPGDSPVRESLLRGGDQEEPVRSARLRGARSESEHSRRAEPPRPSVHRSHRGRLLGPGGGGERHRGLRGRGPKRHPPGSRRSDLPQEPGRRRADPRPSPHPDPAAEQALERASVPFVVDGGRSFFIRSEVVETHAVLRAIDDPSDATSLVAALRSTFFGVSDRAIAEWRFAGKELSILAIDPGAPRPRSTR